MNNIISVSQFNKYVHDIFMAEELLQNIEIFGEVSGLKNSNGSIYFNVKDENALLSCVKFGITSLDYIPNEGDMVVVRGSPNYYIKGGKFSFNVSKITPYGQGLLYQQFIELKNKLEKLGFFDAEIKKAIPTNIRRIGVVTSETGAVIHDIIDITRRRNKMIDIVLFPAKVQGVGAEQTIVNGIKALDTTNVDVIIVARGGGSLEDLSPFNTEIVAKAIYEAKKPVISAVGHETDFTIADFVADLRAPTPSAAAELISSDVINLADNLNQSVLRLNRFVDDYFLNLYSNLDNQTTILQKTTDVFVRENEQKLQSFASKYLRLSLNSYNTLQSDFDKLVARFEANNPIQILKRGYAQATKDNKVVSKLQQVGIGDQIYIKLVDGKLKCEIKDKMEDK